MVPPSAAKSALESVRNIFIFCGICAGICLSRSRWFGRRGGCMTCFWWCWFISRGSMRHEREELECGLQGDQAIGDAGSGAGGFARRKRGGKRFLNAINHDLRTPLNGLMLQTELARLAGEKADFTVLKEALADIKAARNATADLLGRFWNSEAGEFAGGNHLAVCVGNVVEAVVKRVGVGGCGGALSAGVGRRDVTIRCDRVSWSGSFRTW